MDSTSLDPLTRCQYCAAKFASVFEGLDPEQLNEVDKARTFIRFEKQKALPNSLDGRSGFYCIRSGHVRECLPGKKREKILRICGPGDMVGYGSSEYILSSLEEAEACFIPFERFEKLQSLFPLITKNLVKALCRVIQIKDARISGLENHSAKNRVASLLLSLTNKFGEPSSSGIQIAAYVDRITMARLAGTSPETFARVITELEDDRIIARDKRRILILDLETLKAISEE